MPHDHYTTYREISLGKKTVCQRSVECEWINYFLNVAITIIDIVLKVCNNCKTNSVKLCPSRIGTYLLPTLLVSQKQDTIFDSK